MSKKLISIISLVIVLSAVSNVSADLLGQWTFDDGVGTTATDMSGNGVAAELFGDPVWDEAETHGGILVFDGIDDYARIEGAYELETYTLSVWFRVDGGSGSRDIASIYPATAHVHGILLEIQSAGTLRYLHRAEPMGTGGGTSQITTQTYADGSWYHAAAVKTQDKAILYVNGEQVLSADVSTVFDQPVRIDLGFLGGATTTRWFNGALDDVRIYDHAFAASEIPSLMSVEPYPQAYGANPQDGAMLEATWANLGWRAGDFAVSHDLYFGTRFDDVNDGAEGTFVGNLTTTTQVVGFVGFPAPEGLQPATTYYWRVDEVNPDNPDSPWKGNVWSFWIQPTTAYDSSPVDGAINVLQNATLSWTPGMGAQLHQVYFGDNLDDVSNASGAVLQPGTTYAPDGLDSGKTYYWRVDEFTAGVTQKGDVWSFTTVPVIPVTDPDLLCWWKFDEGAGGTALDHSGHDHHGILEGDPQWVDGIVSGALEFDGAGDRVIDDDGEDFLNGLSAITVCMWIKSDLVGTDKGFINCEQPDGSDSFVTMRYDNTGATSGNDDCLKMAVTTTSGESQLETSANTQVTEWQHVAMTWSSGELIRFHVNGVEDLGANRNNPNNTGTLSGCSTLIVGAGAYDDNTASEGWDGLIDDVRIYGKVLTAEEIQQAMRGDTKQAGNPVPGRSALVDIRDISSLSWSKGDTAASHDVYFGQDRNAVANADNSFPEFQGNQTGTSLSLAGLVEFGGGDYYWRVDEVESDGTVIGGTIWKFSVPDYLIVEDFESYNDIEEGQPGSNRIYLTWIDGFGTTTNGALAGNLDPPFMSQGRNSAQAMPLGYDNAGKTSEATRTLTSKKDWTEHGVTKLVLWFRGASGNAAERMFVAVGNATVYHPDAAVTQIGGWTEWVIDLADFASQGVNLSDVPSITIGFGTRGAPVATGGSGTVHLDDIRLYR